MVKKGPVSKLKDELRMKEAEFAEIQSLMLRKAAEFDNARKRWQREQEELRIQARAQVLGDLVEIWDNFERALAVDVEDNEKTLESYRKGVELIFSQFSDALAKYGLKRYSCLGEEFDPGKAEAVGYLETKEVEHGKVVEELKKGFLLTDRVLRPAQVIVARQVKEAKEETEDSDSKGTSEPSADEREVREQGG
jgi:molecular chaperone GrpE